MIRLITRDIVVLSGQGRAPLLSIAFIILAASLFPFAVGPDSARLAQLAPGALWLIGLFLAVLHGERAFVEDDQDGSLEQLISLGHAPWAMVLSRIVAHWVTAFVPLILLVPAVDVLLGGAAGPAPEHMISLAVGTPALSALTVLAAALSLGARGAALLLALLVFPFMIPVMIFGVSAAAGTNAGALPLLGAVSLISLALTPLAGHAALRAALA